MSQGWNNRQRCCVYHHLHRTEQEAQGCRFNPEYKDFEQYPDHIFKRKRKTASGKTSPLRSTCHTAPNINEYTVWNDDSECWESVTPSREQTPTPHPQLTEYPTPHSRKFHTIAISARVPMEPNPFLSVSPTADSLNFASASGTQLPGFLQKSSPVSTSSSARPDSVVQSTERDDNGAATNEAELPSPPATQQYVDQNFDLDALLAVNADLTMELDNQTALSTRLHTRNRIHAAIIEANERELERTQAELQLAWEQTDTLPSGEVEERSINKKTAKTLAVVLLLVLILYGFWRWFNESEFEYIRRRQVKFFEL